MQKLNRHHPIYLVIVCLIISTIPLISLLFPLPDIIIPISIILIISVLLYNYSHWTRKRLIWTSFIAFLSSLWLIWVYVCNPYWSSDILSYLKSKQRVYTKDYCERVSRKDAIKDLKFTYKRIRKIHPALKDTVPQRFQDEYDKAINRLSGKDSISIVELFQTVQTVAATLHDAHTIVYPLYHDTHPIRTSQYGSLISIDGVDLDTIFYDNIHLFSAETEDHALLQFIDAISSYETCIALGLDIDNGVNWDFIQYQGDTVSVLINKDSYFSISTVVPNKLAQSTIGAQSINDSLNIGFLDIPSFICYSKESRKAFRKDISQFFDEVRQNNIGNIIIDVRNNTGGNSGPWHDLMKYFSQDELLYGTKTIRRGPFVFKYDKKCNCKKSAQNPFSGNVFVLTSCRTFSSAMEFVDCIQGNGLATIVGESPGNTPNCYTNIAEFYLPHSRLRLHVSSETTVQDRPGIVNNRIVPDYKCPANQARSKAMELISQQQ